MTTAPQCDECRAILEEFRDALREMSPEVTERFWSAREAFLKLIGSALRRKEIRFPEENGPVRWTISNGFFPVGEAGVEEGSDHDTSKPNSIILAD